MTVVHLSHFAAIGHRRAYVNEPSSGQKLEIGYFKDKTTVGDLREKIRMLLRHRGRAKMSSGCGVETAPDDQWTRYNPNPEPQTRTPNSESLNPNP
jgi:hypothetical protein